jgi:hypothetical protein
MPEFKNELHGARLVVPDRPSVYQVLTYDSARVENIVQPAFLILWEMAKVIISEWECALWPDLKGDLRKADDLQVVKIIEWAGTAVSAWRRGLDEVPKNS